MAALTVRKTGADEYGQYLKALVCGDPGSGKTLVSSTASKVLYASAEGGLMSVADRGVPYVEITESDQLNRLRVVLSLSKERAAEQLGVEVDTVVIDTIDEVQRILARERLDTEKKEQLAQADWGWLGDQVRGLVRGFRNLPVNVIFTAHLKTSEDSETGRTYYKPALQGAMGDEMSAYVDLAVLLRSTTTTKVEGDRARKVITRVMQTVPDPNHPWIKDRSGKLAPEIELNFTDDLQKIFHSVFRNGSVAASVTTATEDQRPPEESKKSATKAKAAASSKVAEPTELPLQSDETGRASEPAFASSPVAPPAPVASPDENSPAEPVTEPVTEPERELPPEAAPELPTEAEPEPAPAATETAEPAAQSEAKLVCEDCGTDVDQDQADLSQLRYHKVLCRTDFRAKKPKR